MPAQSTQSQQRPGSHQQTGNIKCVAWDLDNTLWDGVLLEDPPSVLLNLQHLLHSSLNSLKESFLHSFASLVVH